MLDRLELLLQQLAELDRQRDAVLEDDAPDKAGEMIQQLATLRGIGVQSATVLVREAFVRDFANGKALGSYAGLSATPYSSGSVNREQGIGKAGNRRLRTVMVELAWLWQRYQPDAANVRWYRERAGTTGARMRKVMVVALARKLLSTDVRNWTLFDIKNWTPELNGCPEAQAERLVQVVHRRSLWAHLDKLLVIPVPARSVRWPAPLTSPCAASRAADSCRREW